MNEVRATVTRWQRKEQSVIEWCLCQALHTELSSRLPLRSVRLSYIMLQQISPNLSLRPTHTTHPTQMGRMFCSHSHPGIQANSGIKISEPVAKCGGPQRHLPIPLTMRCTDPATRPQPTTKGPRSCLPGAQKEEKQITGRDSSQGEKAMLYLTIPFCVIRSWFYGTRLQLWKM